MLKDMKEKFWLMAKFAKDTWNKIKLNLGGALYFMILDVKAKISKIKEVFWGMWNTISKWFKGLIDNAKEWGSKLIQMFIDWLKAKVMALKDWIVKVASTISDYLGFRSPTKKWPNSDADKWMPNLININVLITNTSPISTQYYSNTIQVKQILY